MLEVDPHIAAHSFIYKQPEPITFEQPNRVLMFKRIYLVNHKTFRVQQQFNPIKNHDDHNKTNCSQARCG